MFLIVPALGGPEGVVYELLDGSRLTDASGGVKDVRFEDLDGTFRLVFTQSREGVLGRVLDFQVSTRTVPKFRITGRGSFAFQIIPGVDGRVVPVTAIDLTLTVHELKDVFFTSEASLAEVMFPQIQSTVFSLDRRARFAIRIVARPDEEHADRFFRRGDANQDMRIDVTDAVQVLRHLLDPPISLPCADAADVDDDGTIQFNDALLLLRFLFLEAEAPPAPALFCGVDATDDDLDCSLSGGCR